MLRRNEKTIRVYKAGYVVKEEEWSPDGQEWHKMKMAYNLDGDYIGDTKWAHRLCVKRGINPEKANKEHSVCSIGFCDREQKWYGWSHRAIYGFGIGSEVKRGDCAFNPSNKDEFLQDLKDWYSDDMYKNLSFTEVENGIKVYYEIHQKGTGRAICSDNVQEYPEKWGKGEWTAQTLDDAKQMAMDFAESVS
jgi:hypothetical protein